MYGKMQGSGLNEIIPLICTSAVWGQYPGLFHPESPQRWLHRGAATDARVVLPLLPGRSFQVTSRAGAGGLRQAGPRGRELGGDSEGDAEAAPLGRGSRLGSSGPSGVCSSPWAVRVTGRRGPEPGGLYEPRLTERAKFQ